LTWRVLSTEAADCGVEVVQRRQTARDEARGFQSAVATAERICASRQVKLTPLRRRVFEIVWRQREAIGAYEILTQLAKGREKAGPPTVYRALEFLREVGLVHRLDTLNAFVACDRPEHTHAGQFLVCKVCRRVAEIEDSAPNRMVQEEARLRGFRLEIPSIEIRTVCYQCSNAN
jgi:Fur family transcriptional regulator, zinc uptake regulator